MTKSDIPFTEEQLDWLKKNLKLEVETDSYYNGGQDGSMYTEYHCVKLILDNTTISEISIR